MHSAAVGFHCPECVAEGRRTQRAPRTSYGGLVPSAAGTTSMVLVGINAVIWLLISVTGGAGSVITDWFGLLPLGNCGVTGGFLQGVGADACPSYGGQWYPGVADGAVWRLVTSMFTQVGLLHLIFNALNIWILGPQLEIAFGRWRYLAIYLLSGLAGSATAYWLADPHSTTIGASGAVYGLLGALLVTVLKTRQPPQGLLLWVGLGMVYSFMVPGISWQGHLGGFVGGVVVTGLMVLAPRSSHATRTRFQVAGVVAVSLAIAVAVVVRTALLA